ncbi:MAG: peptidoglycan-associated lipoprotein [Alphaproteobacteria bacterium]|nr:peptidoglycan-associated lipoprotein [Alphaproteobacteria bacterium]
MKKQLLSILTTGLVLAACECAPDQNVSVGQIGGPGTPEDFKANIKDRVFFAFNKSNITPESEKTLEAQAGWLKTYPATKAVVAGHCDARGTREYNQALGARRAHAAQKSLVRFGVDKHRLRTLSYGKDNPLVAGDTEEVYAQNRAAVTTIE